MGRGISYGGGQSSLGYLFCPVEPPRADAASAPAANQNVAPLAVSELSTVQKPISNQSLETSINTDIPAGKLSNNQNNYHRAEGQNTGNFITDRPSTKVHSAPGGGSSLGYLFGG